MADETKPPVEKENKKVEIDKSTLAEILKRLDSVDEMKAELAKKDKDIEKLLAVADKGRMQNWESQHSEGELIRTVRLSMWERQVVLGWKTVKNEVGFINGVLREEQTIKVFLLQTDKDGKIAAPKEVEVNLLNFNRFVEKVDAEVIKQSKDSKTNRVTYTVKLKDGMELEYDIAFLN